MYTYQRMAGSALNGLDMFNVSSYWNALKNKIAELQGLGYQISLYQQRLGVAHTRLVARGRKDLAAQLEDEIRKAQDDLTKWWKVKGYIDTYLPEWMKAAGASSPVVSNLSALPIVLGATAIAALAYVVNTGLALLQDYSFKTHLTETVIEGKMTSGQAAEILSVPKEKGVLETVVSNVGTTVGIGLPIALLVGGGLYFAVTTGMLKGLLGGIGGSSSQSQASP